MRDFLITLLTCSVTMSALAVLYMAFMPLLAKRYSEKGRYYTWLVFIVGLIVPFRPQFGNAVVNVSAPAQGGASAPGVQFGNGAPFAIVIPVPSGVAAPLSAPSAVNWWQIAAAVWIGGAVVFLLFHVIRHLRFMKMAARWSEPVADGRALAAFRDLQAELGITKQMELYSCSVANSPMIAGFAKPRILIPSANLAHDELLFILKHELIHYKRKDLYYKCLVLLAAAIHWFNPIVYVIVRAVEAGCELSCDAEVVKRTDAATRQQYTETIIGTIRYKSNMKTAFSINYLGGMNGMKKRLFSIMDTRPKKLGAFILCVAVAAIAVSGSLLAYTSDYGSPDDTQADVAQADTAADNLSAPADDTQADPAEDAAEDTQDEPYVTLPDAAPDVIPDYSYMNDYPAGTRVIVTEPDHIQYVPDHLDCVYMNPADYGCETAEQLCKFLNESSKIEYNDGQPIQYIRDPDFPGVKFYTNPDKPDKPIAIFDILDYKTEADKQAHMEQYHQRYYILRTTPKIAETLLNGGAYAELVADRSDVDVTIARYPRKDEPDSALIFLCTVNHVSVDQDTRQGYWDEIDFDSGEYVNVELTKVDGVWEAVYSYTWEFDNKDDPESVSIIPLTRNGEIIEGR